MSRSKTLYQLQIFDSELDKSGKRILEIKQLLDDHRELDQCLKDQVTAENILAEKQKLLKQAETHVSDHNLKIEQNQRKLYGGAITNPKELEDLQLESIALQNYLAVLEERQLETMLNADLAQSVYNEKTSLAQASAAEKTISDQTLSAEMTDLENAILQIQDKKSTYLSKNDIPDLSQYLSLRKTLNGIAVTLMVSSSCSSCGSSIPSAIEQEARSPKKLANCPTCKRILHPGQPIKG